MINNDAISERVREIVVAIAGPLRTPEKTGLDTPLADGGFWLDSIDILQVIVACESQFGVVLESETDVTADSLGTVGTLAELIRRLGRR